MSGWSFAGNGSDRIEAKAKLKKEKKDKKKKNENTVTGRVLCVAAAAKTQVLRDPISLCI